MRTSASLSKAAVVFMLLAFAPCSLPGQERSPDKLMPGVHAEAADAGGLRLDRLKKKYLKDWNAIEATILESDVHRQPRHPLSYRLYQ